MTVGFDDGDGVPQPTTTYRELCAVPIDVDENVKLEPFVALSAVVINASVGIDAPGTGVNVGIGNVMRATPRLSRQPHPRPLPAPQPQIPAC